MGLETATFIEDLVITNPPGSDLRSQGDDHIRLIKDVLKNTFPNGAKAFYFPDAASKVADYTVVSSDMHKTFMIDTSSNAIALTLPTLVSGDAGWFIFAIKTNAGTNPYFVTPATGTIQSGEVSGLAKARRCIPGHIIKILWTGSNWFAERVPRVPVGSLVDFDGTSLPVGYELPNGQTLSGSSGSLYPEYFSVKGSLVTRDCTGRVTAMKEASATRLTAGGSGVDGATLGATGGLETHTLTSAQLAAHNHTASATSNVTDPGHTHTLTNLAWRTGGGAVDGSAFPFGNQVDTMSTNTTGISVSTSVTVNNSTGGGGAHNNAQPTIILNKLLVVE